MYWGNPQHGKNLQIRSAGRWVRWRHLLKSQEGTDAWGGVGYSTSQGVAGLLCEKHGQEYTVE